MRPVLGTTQRAVARRWANLSRLSTLTLTRDAHAETPGDPLTLHLAERTGYRPAAQILDLFERATLGGFYQNPDGFDGLTLASSGVVSVATDADVRLETYARVLPRDQWAEVRILDATAGLVSGSRAAVGVGLRWSPPSGSGRGYLIRVEHQASGDSRRTTVVRYEAGVVAGTLADAAHPWQVGDVLRAEAVYQKVRVYRNGTLILDLVDSDPLLVGGRAAISVVRADSSDLASLTDFLAGPIRQEYAGVVADMGDVSAALGLLEPTASPAAWDLALINLAAMGGADRFAALIRHGLNDAVGTYDWPRAVSKVWTEFEDGSGPLVVATGKLEGMGGMTEDRVRLAFRGRDAFLEPFIEPGPVNYLPGDDPLLTEAPIGEDPCGTDDDPDVIPGDPPDEPAGPPPPEEEDEELEESGALLGVYRIVMTLRRGDPEAIPEEGEWVKTTTVTEWPPPGLLGSCDPEITQRQFLGVDFAGADFTLSAPYNGDRVIRWGHMHRPNEMDPAFLVRCVVAFYRGPDIGAMELVGDGGGVCLSQAMSDTARVDGGMTGGGVPRHLGPGEQAGFSADALLARYDASGITSIADLEALNLASPDEALDWRANLPDRIETLAEWTQTGVNDGGSTELSDDFDEMAMSNGGAIEPLEISSGATVPLTQLTGPSLLVMELGDVSGFLSDEDYFVIVNIFSGLFLGGVYQGSDFGPSFTPAAP